MRTLLTFIFLIMSIGGGTAIFDADSSSERRVYALAALIGAIGLFVLARNLRRKIGDAAYARLMGFEPKTVARLLKFFGLTVALPVFLYWIVTGHLRIDGDDQALLAAALGVGGLIAWGWLSKDEW